jgi:hypothetical protein
MGLPTYGPVNGSDPYFKTRAVTPSNTVQLPDGVRALIVTGAGTIAVAGIGDITEVQNQGTNAAGYTPLPSLAAGTILPGRWAYVFSTGTSGTTRAMF